MQKVKTFFLGLFAILYNLALLILGSSLVYDYVVGNGPSERGENIWIVFVTVMFLLSVLQLFMVNPKGKEFLKDYPKKPHKWVFKTKAWLWGILWLSLAMYMPFTALFGLLGTIFMAAQFAWVHKNYDANIALAAEQEEQQERLEAKLRQG